MLKLLDYPAYFDLLGLSLPENRGGILASKTCTFDLVEAVFVRELDPGGIVIIGPDGVKRIKTSPATRRAFCIFEIIYLPDWTTL